MLVLSRKPSEKVIAEMDGVIIEITVCEIVNGKVRLGFTAPAHVPIHRDEVYRRIEAGIDNHAGNSVI